MQPKVSEFGIDEANMFEFWDVSMQQMVYFALGHFVFDLQYIFIRRLVLYNAI